MAETQQLSRAAYERLREEHEDLTTRGRIDIARKIEAARELGDLSENGDYHAAKEEQGKMVTTLGVQIGVLEEDSPADTVVVQPPLEKLWLAIDTTDWILGLSQIRAKTVERLLGIWSWLILLNRPVFSVLDQTYQDGHELRQIVDNYCSSLTSRQQLLQSLQTVVPYCLRKVSKLAEDVLQANVLTCGWSFSRGIDLLTRNDYFCNLEICLGLVGALGQKFSWRCFGFLELSLGPVFLLPLAAHFESRN